MTMSDPARNSALKQRIAEAVVEGRVGIAPGLAQPWNLGAQMPLASGSAPSHHSASVSVSCVPLMATDSAG